MSKLVPKCNSNGNTMIVSKKNNFVFVKTRKTAGSTLEKLLFHYLGKQDYCTGSERDNTPAIGMDFGVNGHMPWDKIKGKFANDDWWKKAYKFTIERNPWDKVVSSYFWHKKIKPHEYMFMEFEDYILKSPLLPFDYSLYANRGTVQVDKIYKYENMQEMYDDLNERFFMEIKPEQIQSTRLKSDVRKVQDYKELHTPKTIDFVATKFAPVIKLMGYTYD